MFQFKIKNDNLIKIFISVMLFGGSRIIIMCWMVFVFFAIKHNRSINLGILLSSFYFFIKSLNYFYILYYCGASNWTLNDCNLFLTTGNLFHMPYFETY